MDSQTLRLLSLASVLTLQHLQLKRSPSCANFSQARGRSSASVAATPSSHYVRNPTLLLELLGESNGALPQRLRSFYVKQAREVQSLSKKCIMHDKGRILKQQISWKTIT